MPLIKFETLPEWPEGYADPLFTREEMMRLMLQPGHSYWMAVQRLKDGSELEAGHVLARVDTGSYADILSIYVRPELRRMGHGQLLMAGVITAAHQAGCTGMTLEVRENNFGARALYEACGMAKAHVRTAYYPDGEDAAVYTMALPH